jgi:hypothetical protein
VETRQIVGLRRFSQRKKNRGEGLRSLFVFGRNSFCTL